MGWKRRVGHYFISDAIPDLVKVTDIAASNRYLTHVAFITLSVGTGDVLKSSLLTRPQSSLD
jgi:hypothetical protein